MRPLRKIIRRTGWSNFLECGHEIDGVETGAKNKRTRQRCPECPHDPSITGRRNRTKGREKENELAKLLDGKVIRGRTLSARRISRPGERSSDVLVGEQCPRIATATGYPPHEFCDVCKSTGATPGTEEFCEAKFRKGGGGFKQIEKWIDGAFALFLKSPKSGWLVVQRVEDWIEKDEES